MNKLGEFFDDIFDGQPWPVRLWITFVIVSFVVALMWYASMHPELARQPAY
jgi:hypothetical protein